MEIRKVVLLLMLFSGCAAIAFAGGAKELSAQELGEGRRSVEAAGIRFTWSFEGSELICVLEAESDGWLSVGFNPSRMMKDANIIFAYVEEGKLSVFDEYGTGVFSHSLDTELGGSSDLRPISGSEASGKTRLSFALPVDSDDRYDTIFREGQEYIVLLARGPSGSDTRGKKHAAKAKLKLRL